MRVSIHAASRRDRKRARHFLAFLDGVDVTHRCQAVDTTVGRALLLTLNAEGRPYIDNGRVAKAWVHGRVTLRRR